MSGWESGQMSHCPFKRRNKSPCSANKSRQTDFLLHSVLQVYFWEQMPMIWDGNNKTLCNEENNTVRNTTPISADKSWREFVAKRAEALSSQRNSSLNLSSAEKVSLEGGQTFVIKWFCIGEKSTQSTSYWFHTAVLEGLWVIDDVFL